MHLFDVINLYISLYNFGQILRWFDSPRFLEWLIIWNGGSTSHALCLWSYLCDSQDHIGTTDTHFMFWCHLFCHLSWFAAICISVRLERACSSMFEVQIQWKQHWGLIIEIGCGYRCLKPILRRCKSIPLQPDEMATADSFGGKVKATVPYGDKPCAEVVWSCRRLKPRYGAEPDRLQSGSSTVACSHRSVPFIFHPTVMLQHSYSVCATPGPSQPNRTWPSSSSFAAGSVAPSRRWLVWYAAQPSHEDEMKLMDSVRQRGVWVASMGHGCYAAS